MSNSNKRQRSQRKTICNDCAFNMLNNGSVQCTHPDELEVDCSTVVFCNSFQAAQEIDSPCVSFDFDSQ